MIIPIIDVNSDAFTAAIEYLSKLQIFGLDTETNGIDALVDKVLLLSAGDEETQYVFDLARLGGVPPQLRKLLEDKDHLKLLHNAKFDYLALKGDYGIEVENIFDTMLAEILLTNGRQIIGFDSAEEEEEDSAKKTKGKKKVAFGLDAVSLKYLNITLDKTLQKSFVGVPFGSTFTQEQIDYSASDVQHMIPLFQAQKKFIARENLSRVAELEMQTVAPTADMELNGLFLNTEKWLEAKVEAAAGRDEYLKKLDAVLCNIVPTNLFGQPNINYNSPAQLLAVLNQILAPQKIKLKTTNENELTLYKSKSTVISDLLNYRMYQKRLTTYGEEFLQYIHPTTGRVHSTFHQAFVETGRYSSANPNLQNIPAKDTKIYRKAFTRPNDSRMILDADYSAMELRLLADLGKDPTFLEIFEKDLDPHSVVGTMITGKEIRKKGALGPDDPGVNSELRDPVKSLNFMICYGGGPKKLSDKTGLEYKTCRRFIDEYWKRFPNNKKFFDDFVQESVAEKCVRSKYDGRLRWLDGFDFDNSSHASHVRNLCMNFNMQSGNASITKLALVKLREAIKGTPCKIVATIHDEILCETDVDRAQEDLATLMRCMLEAAGEYVKHVKVTAEGKADTYWNKA